MSSTMPPSIKEFEIVNKIVGYFNNNVPNVIASTDWTLRRSAERFASFTKFGNVAVHSSVKNRSAKISVYIGSDTVRLQDAQPPANGNHQQPAERPWHWWRNTSKGAICAD